MVSHSEGSGGNVPYNLHKIAFCFNGSEDSLDRGHDHSDTGDIGYTQNKSFGEAVISRDSLDNLSTAIKLVFTGLILSECLCYWACGIVTLQCHNVFPFSEKTQGTSCRFQDNFDTACYDHLRSNDEARLLEKLFLKQPGQSLWLCTH